MTRWGLARGDDVARAAAGLAAARSPAQVLEALRDALGILVDPSTITVRELSPTTITAPEGESVRGAQERLVLRYGTQPALSIEFSGGGPPPELDAPIQVFAALAGAVLGQLELQATVLRRSLDLSRLHDASRRLAAAESAEEVMCAAAEGLGEITEGGVMALYAAQDGVLALSRTNGCAEDFPASLRLVDRFGNPLLGGGGSTALRPGLGTLGGHSSLVRVLAAAGETLGVLVLRAPHPDTRWAEETVALSEALAEHLALALRNVQLLELSRHQAAFDELTGLTSRRHFLAELGREIERVRRQGTALSMLMVDADHFKAINDTWGHSAGDAVLRALAACLKVGTRSLDVVGRLGGEELGVLLPSADGDTAMRVAERLRASIERTVIDWRGAQLRVTVSIGVAEWDPEMALEDLTEAADLALYEAKRLGRNRIMAAPKQETLLGS